MKNQTLAILTIVAVCWGAFFGCAPSDSDNSERSLSDSSKASTASLRITNYTNSSILYLYVSPSSQNLWGDDQLGSSTIGVGENLTLINIPCGRSYDVKAVSSLKNYYNLDNYFECGVSYYWNISVSSSRTDRKNQESAIVINEEGSKPASRPAIDTETLGTEDDEKESGSLTQPYQISEK